MEVEFPHKLSWPSSNLFWAFLDEELEKLFKTLSIWKNISNKEVFMFDEYLFFPFLKANFTSYKQRSWKWPWSLHRKKGKPKFLTQKKKEKNWIFLLIKLKTFFPAKELQKSNIARKEHIKFCCFYAQWKWRKPFSCLPQTY